MLVCNVSMRPARRAIAADLAETAAAADSPGTGNVVFATLVDDPASVLDIVDAYLGEIMLEAASAAESVDAGLAFVGDIVETATAATTQDGSVTAAPSAATWEPATVSAVTLSGSNLVATNTGTTSTNQGAHVAFASAKATSGGGKYYFEVTVTSYLGGAGVGVGMGLTTATYPNMSTTAVNGTACYVVGHTGSGTIFLNSSNIGWSLGALASGDTMGIAVDFVNNKCWFRKCPSGIWDGVAGHDPTNPTSGGGVILPTGSLVPFVTFGSGPAGAAGVANNVMTANFGASSFVGAVPSGYTAGFPP